MGTHCSGPACRRVHISFAGHPHSGKTSHTPPPNGGGQPGGDPEDDDNPPDELEEPEEPGEPDEPDEPDEVELPALPPLEELFADPVPELDPDSMLPRESTAAPEPESLAPSGAVPSAASEFASDLSRTSGLEPEHAAVVIDAAHAAEQASRYPNFMKASFAADGSMRPIAPDAR